MYKIQFNYDGPDKIHEYFWLSFKKIILDIDDDILKTKIIDTSNILNKYQKEEKYDLIHTTINNFMETNYKIFIVKNIIEYKYGTMDLIETYLKRWNKIEPLCTFDSLEYKLLISLNKYYTKNNDSIIYVSKYLETCLWNNVDTIKVTEDTKEDLYLLINESIKNKYIAILNIISEYFNDELYNFHINKELYNKNKFTKGEKLLKLLKTI